MEIIDVAEHIYQGQYEVAPSILPHKCQDQFMTNNHEEPGQHWVMARLQSVMETAQSLSRGRRHLWAHSLSNDTSPSAEGRRKEIAKQPRGYSLLRSYSPVAEVVEAEGTSRVYCQSTNKPVMHLPGLLEDPTGIPHHLKVCCTHPTRMTNCTAL